jgi:hypothetical protein
VRRPLALLALLLCLVGLLWLLQGINVLPGSVMSGDPVWAQVGVGMWLLGLGALYLSRRGSG